MKEININELKEIQLEIMDYVHAFCIKHEINYWIDNGTLLGAIRHGGYIPWDDDIDIGMLREDYDRFLKLFNQSSDKYKVYSIENKRDFMYPFAKVLDLDTVIYEPNEEGIKIAINIDVFVYDNAPDDLEYVKKMYKKRDKYNKYYHFLLYKTKIKSEGKFSLIKDVCKGALEKISPAFLCKKIIKNSKRFCNFETTKVGNFTSISKIYCDKKLVSTSIDVKFEDRVYKAPAGYDEWLRAFYGDYMELPPKEKQISHHLYKAYVK